MNIKLPPTAGTEASVVFITMHKAASVFVNQVLTGLFNTQGIPAIDFAQFAFDNGLDEGKHCVSAAHLLGKPGYYFGPFRGTYVKDFPDLSGNRLIVQVRDPRDCIVSFYYSVAYSHVASGDEETATFNEKRETTQNTAINDYALSMCNDYNERLDIIRDIVEKQDDVLILEYADMVERFPQWLDSICRYLGVELPGEVIRNVCRSANFNVREDPLQHKRQVTPGDFRRKLTRETQQRMTALLYDHLVYFGYPT